jgi:glycosyltransferase involved in cell wall biosynthesis
MTNSKNQTFTVVMPCYNESKNIPLILSRFEKITANDNSQVELLLVDNGSTDDSPATLAIQLPQFSFARSLRVSVNQGYGFGILEGLRACQSDYIGWTHADMQTDPSDIVKAIDLIKQANYPEDIYVKGLRRGRPLSDSFFTGGMSLFETCFMGTNLWDINAQPNIFHRSFVQSWTQPPNDFALDLYAYYMARQKNLNIVRFDVVFPPRIHGESKWNTGFKSKVKFIKRTIDFSIKLKHSLSHSAKEI